MPGTTRTFNYTLIPGPDDVPLIEKRVRKVVGYACDGDDRITCHDVTGEALGAITISFTVKGRDRWWATQLAQDIINLITWGLKTNATRLDLQSHRQQPHQNRGYAHGRTKRTRTQRQFSSPETTSSGPVVDEPLDGFGAPSTSAEASTDTDSTGV